MPNKCLSGLAFLFQPDKSPKYWTVWSNTEQVTTLGFTDYLSTKTDTWQKYLLWTRFDYTYCTSKKLYYIQPLIVSNDIMHTCSKIIKYNSTNSIIMQCNSKSTTYIIMYAIKDCWCHKLIEHKTVFPRQDTVLDNCFTFGQFTGSYLVLLRFHTS